MSKINYTHPKADKINVGGYVQCTNGVATIGVSVQIVTTNGEHKEFDVPKEHMNNIQEFVNTLEL